MNTQNWYILIYSTASEESQELLATQLRNVGGLIVQTEQDGVDHFVVIESPERVAAITLHELVMTIDSSAELVDSHQSAPRPISEPALEPSS